MSKVIVAAQTKGGVSKSTSCLIFAQVLASRGFKVCIIDCDPSKTLVTWAKGNNSKLKIDVVGDITDSTIIGTINAARKNYDYVFVDLEGTGNVLVSRSILKSDFVVIPMKASMPDAIQANKMIRLIKDEEEVLERPIKHAFIFTQTSAQIKTKIERAIADDIEKAGYPIFQTHLSERSAYKAVFVYKCSLEELPDSVSGVEKAIANANTLTDELLEYLK